MKKPLVSAIVSTYNSEKFIRAKIEDLLAQTIIDKMEIIIVNSGSQQNEDIIIKEYLSKHSNIIYVKTEVRETIYKAWNRGIEKARGQFVTNANTDDALKNNALEILSNYLLDNCKVGLVYADQYISTIENEKFAKNNKEKIVKFPEYNRFKQIERCLIGSQPMWRNEIHINDGIWFNKDFEVCGDQEFALSIPEKYSLVHISEILGTFYKPPQKSNKECQDPERNMREIRKIWDNKIPQFVESLDSKGLSYYKNLIRKYYYIPIPLYIILKLLDDILLRSLYPKILFHSYQFMNCVNESISLRISAKNELINFQKKIDSYNKVMLVLRKIKRLFKYVT